MSSEIINFIRSLDIITSHKKDVILIYKKYPRIYRIPKDYFFHLKKNPKINPDLIKDYNNLRRWLYLPNKKRQRRYSDYPMLSLRITEDCNLNCRYCFNRYYGLNTKQIKYMSEETAIKALNFFLSHIKEKKVWVIFFGGEPFLNFPVIKKTVEYIKKIKNKKFILTIVTNGTIMNKSACQWLSDNNIEIMVSLDLPSLVHDKNRPFKDGSPSFEIVKNNLLLLAKNIPPKNLRVRSVITKDSNIGIPESFNAFYTSGIPIYDLCPAPEVIGVCHRDSLAKEFHRNFESQKKEIRNTLLQKIVTAKSNRFSHLGLYKRYVSSPPALFIIMDGKVPERECNFESQMSIDPAGDIYFCDIVANLKDLCLGNIKNGFDKTKLKSIREKYLLKPEYCINCWASSFCHRFCPGLRPFEKFQREECREMKTEFIEILKFFLNLNYNQIQKILQFMLYATYDKDYIKSQRFNFKTFLEIYKFLNETNKYIKPVNILPLSI